MLFLVVALLFVSVFPNMVMAETYTTEGIVGFLPYTQAHHIYQIDYKIPRYINLEGVVDLTIFVKGDFQASTSVGVSISGVSCTPATWTTPSVDSPDYHIEFDCKGIVPSGQHMPDRVTFQFYTSRVAQNVLIKYKLSYTPKEKEREYVIRIHGTEYIPGERGKVFLQLLDSDSLPIENATCYCSIYYPDGFDEWKEDQFMTYTGEGLYFYPFVTPYTAGVYMVSAYCIIPEPNWTVYQAYDDFESASESGGTGDWQNDWYLEGNADFSTGNPYQGSYSLRLRGGNGYADRPVISSDEVDKVVVSFWARVYSLESVDFGYFVFCGNDNSSNCTIAQTWTQGDDDNMWHYYSFTFLKKDFNWSERVWIKFDGIELSDSGDVVYIDNLNVTMIKNEYNKTEYQTVRGSGEVHVSDGMEYSYYFNDGHMDLTEGNEFGGTAYLNLTVRSLVAETQSVDVSINGFDYYFCTDILDFRFWNGTEWVSVTNYTCYYDSSVGQSVLTFTQDFNRSDIYNYYFKLRNKWYRTFDFIYSGMNKTYDVVYDICEWYFDKDGKMLPSFPLNETTQNCVNVDSVECWCEHILETIYQARVKRQFVDSLNTSYDNPSSLDAMYQYMEALVELDKDLRPNYDTYVNQLFNYIIVSGDYAHIFPFKYFGNESRTYLIWNWTQNANVSVNATEIAEAVWSYYNRTLTENCSGGGSCDINVTEIAQAVWEYSNRTVNLSEVLDAIAGLNNLSLSEIVSVVATQDNVTTILAHIDGLNNLSLSEIQSLNLATQDNITTVIAKIDRLNNLSLDEIVAVVATQDNVTTILTSINNLNNLSLEDIVSLELATQENVSTIVTHITNLNNLSLDDIRSLNLATQENVTTIISKIEGLNNLSLSEVVSVVATQENVTTILTHIDGLNNLSLDDIISLNLATQDNVSEVLMAVQNLNNLSLDEIVSLQLATQENVTTILTDIANLNNLSIEEIEALELATQQNISDVLLAIQNLNNLSLGDILSLNLSTQDNVTLILQRMDSLATQDNITYLAGLINNLNNLSLDDIVSLNLSTQENVSQVLMSISHLNNLSLDDIQSLNLATQDNITTLMVMIQNLNNLSLDDVVSVVATQDNVSDILVAIGNLNNLSLEDIVLLNLATQENISTVLVAIDNLNNLSLEEIENLNLSTQENITTIITEIEGLNNLSLQDIVSLNLSTQDNVTTILSKIYEVNLTVTDILVKVNNMTINLSVIGINVSDMAETVETIYEMVETGVVVHAGSYRLSGLAETTASVTVVKTWDLLVEFTNYLVVILILTFVFYKKIRKEKISNTEGGAILAIIVFLLLLNYNSILHYITILIDIIT